MERSRRFMKIASCHSLRGCETESDSVVSSVGTRSKSLESCPRTHKHSLELCPSPSFQTLCGDVKNGDPKDILGDTTDRQSTTSDSIISVKSVRALCSVQHHDEKQCVVSSCPTINVHRCCRDFARKWSSVGIPSALSFDYTTDNSSDDSTYDSGEMSKSKTSDEKFSRVDFSSVFRERSKTWSGQDIRPYKSKSLYSTRSYGDESVLVFYLDNPRDKIEHFLSEYRKTIAQPCICRPSDPPSVVCSNLVAV
ncbi:uncharacterized protein LOC126370376 [Pectinophora gossypiella]|uniref:uncharacterized protein LOC126370376 n=1 Tax=Pectinophora gossypiella TaxID=13191 RepID=UPI00214E56E3|nr:uncharacterized protein LOC126370376 [Pectinophora gossypiella]